MDANNLLPSEGTPGFTRGLPLAALTARELADAWLQRGWPHPRPAALKLAQDLVAAGFPSIQSLATASQESLKRLPIAHDDLEWVVHDARRCVASHADGCSHGDIDHLDHPMPASGVGSPGENRAVSRLTIAQKSLSGASLATGAGSRGDGRSSVSSVESLPMDNLLDGDPSSTAQFPWADPDPFASRVGSPHTGVCDWLHHEAKLGIEQARAVAAALHSRLASPARRVTMDVLRPLLCEQLLRSTCPGIDSTAIHKILAKCEEERHLDDSPTLSDSQLSQTPPPPASSSAYSLAGDPFKSSNAMGAPQHSATAGGAGAVTYAASSVGAFASATSAGSPTAAGAPIATLGARGARAGFDARAQVYAGLGAGASRADGQLVFQVHGQSISGVIRGDTNTLLAEARDRVTPSIKPVYTSPKSSDVRFRFVHALSLEPIPVEAEWSTTVLQAGGFVVVQVYDTARHKQFFPPVCVCCAVLNGGLAGAYVLPTAKGGKPWGRPIPKKVQLLPNAAGALVAAGRHSNERVRCCDSHARNMTKLNPVALTSVSHSACMWHVVGMATGVTLVVRDGQTTVTVGYHVRAAGCPCGRTEGAGCQAQALQRSVDRLKPLGIFEQRQPIPPIASPRAMPMGVCVQSPPALSLDHAAGAAAERRALPGGAAVDLHAPPAPPPLEVETQSGEVRVVHHPNGVHIVRSDRLQVLPDHPIRDGALATPHDQWLLTVQGWPGRHTRLPIRVLQTPDHVLVGARLKSLLPGLASSPGRRQKAVLQHVAPGDFIMPCDQFRAVFTIVHVRIDDLPEDDQRQARREIMNRFASVLQDHCRFKRRRDKDDDDDSDDRGGHRRRPPSSGSGSSGGTSASDGTSNGSNSSSGASSGNGEGYNSGAGGGSYSGGSCEVSMDAPTDDAAFYAANAPPRMATDEDPEHSFIVWLEFVHHLQTSVPDDGCPPLAEYTTGASHGNYGAVHVAAFIGPAALAFALQVCRLDPQQLCADGTAFDVATKFGPQACVRILEGIIDERTSESSATASAAASLRSTTPPARAAVDRVPPSLSIQGGDDSHGSGAMWDLGSLMQQAKTKVEVAGSLPALAEADEQAAKLPNPCTDYMDNAACHQLGIDAQRCAQGRWAGTPPPSAAKHKHRPRGATVHRIKSGADIVPSSGFDPHQRCSTGSLVEGDTGEFKGCCSPTPRLAKPTPGVVHGTVAPDLRQRAPIGTSLRAVASPSAEQAQAQHMQLIQRIETLLASAKADPSFAGHVASMLCKSNMLGFAPAPRRPRAFQQPASVVAGAGKGGSQYCHGCTSTVPVPGAHELLPGASTPLCDRCCTLVRCLQDTGFNPSVDQYDDRIAHILTLINFDASPTTREDVHRPPHLEWTVAARHATVSLVRVDRRTGLPTGPRIELPEYRNETKRITFVPPGRYMVEMSAIPRAGDWVDLSLGVGLSVCESSTNQYKLVKLPLQNRPGSGRRGHRVDGGEERATRPLSSTKQCFVDAYQVCARGEAVSIMPQFGPVDLEAGSTCRLAALACLAHEIIKDHDDDFSDLDQQHWLAFKIFCYRDSAPSAELGSDAERAPLRGSPSECSRSVPSRFNEDAESDCSPVVQDFKVQPGLNSFDIPRKAHAGRTTPPPSQRQGQLRPIAIDNGTKRDTRGHSVASAISTPGSLPTRSATCGQDPPVTAGHTIHSDR